METPPTWPLSISNSLGVVRVLVYENFLKKNVVNAGAFSNPSSFLSIIPFHLDDL